MNKTEIDEIGASIQETQIEQYLNGLKRMPMMVSRARELATRDPDMAEALRRFDAGE